MKRLIWIALNLISHTASAQDHINLNDLMGVHQASNAAIVIREGFTFPGQQQQQQQPNGPYVGCVENSNWQKFVLKREVKMDEDRLIATDLTLELNPQRSQALRKKLAVTFASKKAVLNCEGSHIKPVFVFYNFPDSDDHGPAVLNRDCFSRCTNNGGEASECTYGCEQSNHALQVDYTAAKAACELQNVNQVYHDQLYECKIQAE